MALAALTGDKALTELTQRFAVDQSDNEME